MEKKRSCFNCKFAFPNEDSGLICANTYYGKSIFDLNLKLCEDWRLSFNDFINLFEELKEQDIDLWNHYINGNGNTWEYVYKIYKGD